MGEFGELDAVFFAEEGLVVAPFFYAVDLDRLVALRGHAEVAGVVKVDGEDRG